MVKRAALKRRLLERDSYRCGVHVGGCGRKLTKEATTIDHIVPRNILRINPEIYDQLASDESFLQPMCQDCNSARKQGTLDVAFACKCHSATFFSQSGRLELLVSHTKGYFIRRLRISAEESRDGTYLYIWGKTKKGMIGFRPSQFGGVFEYPTSLSDENSDTRIFRPIHAEVRKELIVTSPDVSLVLTEHIDLNQIAREASFALTAIGDALQSSIQSLLRQHSGALLALNRAISSAGEQYAQRMASVFSAQSRTFSKLGVQATRNTSYVLPEVNQRIVQQMHLATRDINRALYEPRMQQMLAGTRTMNRIMKNMALRSARRISLAFREIDRALATPQIQKTLAGIREMNRAYTQENIKLQQRYALVNPVENRFPISKLLPEK